MAALRLKITVLAGEFELIIRVINTLSTANFFH